MAKILVIEDNAATMRLTTLVMRWAGHRVLSTVDAETGLKLARTGKPDLIIMDIVLSGMDGLAATALLKADPTTARIPIIALTWSGTKNDEKRAMAAGCDAYITKPFRRQQLDKTIEDLLKAAIENLLIKSGPDKPNAGP